MEMRVKLRKKPKRQTTLQSFEAAKELKEMRRKWVEEAVKNLPRQIALKKEQLERSNLPLDELEHYEGRLIGQLKELRRKGEDDLVVKMAAELGVVREFIKRKRDEGRKK